MNFRDDEHCINTGGGYAEVIVLICRTYRLVIHRNLVYENAINTILCEKDLVAFVEDSDGLRTGQAIK